MDAFLSGISSSGVYSSGASGDGWASNCTWAARSSDSAAQTASSTLT